jgi:CheY-like chemotaxis protein
MEDRILIVDDEVGTRESLKMILKNDYEVLLAKNAEEAFQVFKERSPDVILLDIILPDLDGLKVLEKIKQKDSDMIIIMITNNIMRYIPLRIFVILYFVAQFFVIIGKTSSRSVSPERFLHNSMIEFFFQAPECVHAPGFGRPPHNPESCGG